LRLTCAKAIRAFDPDLPVYNVRSMQGRVSESLARRRFAVLLFSCFAVAAVALGASPRQILRAPRGAHRSGDFAAEPLNALRFDVTLQQREYLRPPAVARSRLHRR
jgi:hypothetical protein